MKVFCRFSSVSLYAVPTGYTVKKRACEIKHYCRQRPGEKGLDKSGRRARIITEETVDLTADFIFIEYNQFSTKARFPNIFLNSNFPKATVFGL